MLDRFLRPKWDVVSKFVVLELEELIFLSLDVNLEAFKDIRGKIRFCGSQSEAYEICAWIGYDDDYLDYINNDLEVINQNALDRLAVAENHIRYGRLLVLENRPKYIWDKIELVTFGDWASSVGFELPDEFPRTIKEPVSAQKLYQQLGINNQQQNLEEKKEVNRTHISRHAANARWGDDPKAYAMRKAYEEWLRADKSGGYRSKLAAHLLENVDGIKGVLTNQKYLAEKFGKWDKGEELPEC